MKFKVKDFIRESIVYGFGKEDDENFSVICDVVVPAVVSIIVSLVTTLLAISLTK